MLNKYTEYKSPKAKIIRVCVKKNPNTETQYITILKKCKTDKITHKASKYMHKHDSQM